MNSLIVVALMALASANAGLLAPSARIIQGPSSRTTVVGPDGSSISSVAPGGTIIAEDHAGLVARTAPVVATYAAAPYAAYAASPVAAYAAPAWAHSAYAAPILGHSAYSASILGHSAYAAPIAAAPALAYAAPGIASDNTVIAGPSGTIATSKSVQTAGLVAHAAPLAYSHGLYI